MNGDTDKPDPAEFAPGTFGCHEALHVTNMMGEVLEMYLAQHPAIQANPAWRARVEQAQEELAALYQEIGVAHFGESKVGPAQPMLNSKPARRLRKAAIVARSRQHMTRRAVADVLQISVAQVVRMEGKLAVPVLRIGRSVRYDERAWNHLVEALRTCPSSSPAEKVRAAGGSRAASPVGEFERARELLTRLSQTSTAHIVKRKSSASRGSASAPSPRGPRRS
jgi:hypothetical protein